MPTAAKRTLIGPEEYIARERVAEIRSEYLDGETFPMLGARRPHNVIAANLGRVIGNQVADTPCEIYIADMRVSVDPEHHYVYPDLVVVRNGPSFLDEEFDTLLNPTVLIEILSPTTERWDRGGKADRYRRIESLRDLVLISQERMRVETQTRREDRWVTEVREGPDEILRLDSIGVELTLREIYAKVNLPEKPPIGAG